MSSVLSGIKIAVLGGDDREAILVHELVKMGATVTVAGFPRDMVCHGALPVNTVEDACKEAEVVIMPLPGTNPEGVIRAVYTEEPLLLTYSALQMLPAHALVIIGSARPYLKEWCETLNLSLLEIAEIDEIAIPNSIPTAEGALQIAIMESRITIHGSKSCVIGFGRVGITLARCLKALGAEVTVVARNQGQLARAQEMGCRRAEYDQLKQIMKDSDLVFNTVPALVLTAESLKHANPNMVVIDLATQPGGTDFEAANNFGLKAILAPGLPGKVAPVTSGKILAEVVPRLIVQEMSRLGEPLLLD
ncbi:MAG TPA: dipicolinic acid synthetase subunit A [Syntrophomonas sp.]|nr:dipicolinic acid synthetase subunit A [Syntrophomonas sp.]